MAEPKYLTPAQVGKALIPPRTAERVRQLCQRGDIPYTPAEEVLGSAGVNLKAKYLIRREDMERFRDQVDPFRRNGRPRKNAGTARAARGPRA